MEQGLSASATFWFEVALLERLLYKNKNQHRRTLHFQRLQLVHRLLSAVRTSSKAKGLLDTLMNCASSGTSSIMGLSTLLGGLCGLLGQLLDAIKAACQTLIALLAQSFFMPFALTVLACLARIHSIASEAKGWLDKQSGRAVAIQGSTATMDSLRLPQKQSASSLEAAIPLSLPQGGHTSMPEITTALEAVECLRPEKRARLGSNVDGLKSPGRQVMPESTLENTPVTSFDHAKVRENTPEQTLKRERATDWLQDLGIEVPTPSSRPKQRRDGEASTRKKTRLQNSRKETPMDGAANSLLAGTDFESFWT